MDKDFTLEEISDSIQDLWSRLTENQQIVLAESISIRHCRKNEKIYSEHEEPKWLYCIMEGQVKIYRDGVGGRSQIMHMVKRGEYFGYRAYFAKERFVTTASAFETTTLCAIPMEVIAQMVLENNELAMFFIRNLSLDLGKSDQRTVNLTQKHIRGRLAESLLFLKDSYGLESDGATIGIYLSREDLANLSNMTTANAIRTLSNFAQEHIIAIDGRKIKILNEEALRKVDRMG